MRRNEKQSIVGLIAGVGLVVLLLGILTGLTSLSIISFRMSLIWAVSLWVLSIVIGRWIGARGRPSGKRALVSLAAGAGFVVLIMGLLNVYFDWIVGIIVAILLWVFSGILKSHLRESKAPKDTISVRPEHPVETKTAEPARKTPKKKVSKKTSKKKAKKKTKKKASKKKKTSKKKR